MRAQRLVLLCGRTVRSSVYVQALANANIVPDAVLVYGDGGGRVQSTRQVQGVMVDDLFAPDPCRDLVDCLDELDWPYQVCSAKSLTDPVLLMMLEALSPGLVVYSGYAGQLVPAELLHRYSVLHVHSGWLPDYRGSTTLYYHIIEQGESVRQVLCCWMNGSIQALSWRGSSIRCRLLERMLITFMTI